MYSMLCCVIRYKIDHLRNSFKIYLLNYFKILISFLIMIISSLGFCYTLCYAAVVTKTNRISRIFAAKKSHPSCTSPAASVMISLSLAMVEVGVNVCWLIFEPASTKYIFEPNQRILVCSGELMSD